MGSPSAMTRVPWLAIGSVDEQLLTDQIACVIRAVLGFRPQDLIGTPLVQLVAQPDRARFLEVIRRAGTSEVGATARLSFNVHGGGTRTCQLVLMPKRPHGGYAFAIIASRPPPEDPEQRDGSAARRSELTGRESEIVAALVRGDRVPAIARRMYLNPGTVRNHLSSAFRKLGVGNQQELIDLLRGSD
jgi:DNA-binding CsgD family transcriptional regulator